MAHEFVFTLNDLRKVVPPDRVIVDGITLAFLPGAKIGVLGANGSGKSSLLKIMAGVDKDFLGEAQADAGPAHRLSCRRSPSSTPRRTCAATSRTAWPSCAICCAASRRSRRSSASRSATTR